VFGCAGGFGGGWGGGGGGWHDLSSMVTQVVG